MSVFLQMLWEYVQEHPWQAVLTFWGIAIVVGVITGWRKKP